MGVFEAILSDNELLILKDQLGKEFLSVLSPSIDIRLNENHYLFYEEISLSIGKMFLVISNEWLESKKYEDYWRLKLKFQDYPEMINYQIDKTFGKMISGSRSSIDIVSAPIINSISIYSRKNEIAGENIYYDEAIIFNTNDGQRYCFSPMHSIADAIEFRWISDEINVLLADCFERCKLEI
ncbi:hypothetical protein RAH41_19680 [Gottfriedia acidiceleris]|uniref:hypothetical protein n=1 Tax=Gottfriedia acidiceleris TaxID=371036 RepID=UPI002F26D6C3